jgi:hypothetical protein
MKLLSLNDWLNLFDLTIITKNKFKKIYTMNEIDLNMYLKNKYIDQNDLNALYKLCIQDRKDYLINFYNKSLKIPENMDLDSFPLSMNNSKNCQLKNLFRNIYYIDILLNTTSAIKNIKPYLQFINDLFNNKIIDYKLMTPGSLKLLTQNKRNMISGYYFRASILNPMVIYTLSKKYFKGSKVFTPTLGWSTYLYGLLSNKNIDEYVGTDVIPHVCNNTQIIAKNLFKNKKTSIYCIPSEELINKKIFIDKYTGYFDIIFFSPPYYDLEIYKGGIQSTEKYINYSDWLYGYWKTTIKLCRILLKDNGILCYIISNYNGNNLVDDMNNITKDYFKFKRKVKIENTKANWGNTKNIEFAYMFQNI